MDTLIITNNDKNIIIIDRVEWCWDLCEPCTLIVEDINSQFTQGRSIQVFLKGNVDADWFSIDAIPDASPTAWFAYEVSGNTLTIRSLKIDCNFDSADYYSVKIKVL